MRAALMLAVLAGLLTAGCLGNKAPEPEIVVVTVTQEVPPNAAGPTPTWKQWLGEQVAKGECGNPSNTLMYQNVSREPPYSADFFCRASTRVPNIVATQVAATVAAIPTPTRQPRATPRPTLAPVSTPTPAWQQTATPYPTPTFNEWLGWKTSTLKCEDPRDELALETAQWTWPYEASFSCMSPTPIPQPTSTPRPTSTPWPTSAPWTAPTRQPPPTPMATPTMQQMAEWGPETRHAWDQCWRARGEFEIGNIRQGPDGNWTWQYRCNPPLEPEQRRQTEGVPPEDLIACGFGIAGLLAGDWISVLGCLGLLDN